MTKNNDQETTKLYLIAPTDEAVKATRVQDGTVQNEGRMGDAWRALVGGREEIEVDDEVVKNQINNYVTVLREVAEKDSAVENGGIKLSEITLSLTISAKGNIGIASTSAEAGLKLVFKRG